MIAKTIKDLIILDEVHHVLLPQRRDYPAVIFFEQNSDRLTTKDGAYQDRESWGFLICARTTLQMNTMQTAVMAIDQHSDTDFAVRFTGKGDIAYDEDLKIYYKQLDFQIIKNI